MVRIYSYDVDFQRKVQPGDSFDVFFAGEDEGTTITEKTEVLFASLTVGGETKKYYRFQTPDDSVVDYYDETGKSAKKFLVRKPVNNAIMRGIGQRFPSRDHPRRSADPVPDAIAAQGYARHFLEEMKKA